MSYFYRRAITNFADTRRSALHSHAVPSWQRCKQQCRRRYDIPMDKYDRSDEIRHSRRCGRRSFHSGTYAHHLLCMLSQEEESSSLGEVTTHHRSGLLDRSKAQDDVACAGAAEWVCSKFPSSKNEFFFSIPVAQYQLHRTNGAIVLNGSHGEPSVYSNNATSSHHYAAPPNVLSSVEMQVML